MAERDVSKVPFLLLIFNRAHDERSSSAKMSSCAALVHFFRVNK